MKPATSETRQRVGPLDVIVTGLSSDAHTWNLVFIHLLLEDLGHRVVNLGPCTPHSEIVEACRRRRPDLVVVSSINGHGFNDAGPLIGALRSRWSSAELPVVIGGKLGIFDDGRDEQRRTLLDAGYDGVFDEHVALASFEAFVGSLPKGVAA